MQPIDDDDDDLLQLVTALERSALRPEHLKDQGPPAQSTTEDQFDELVTDPEALRRLLGLR